MRQIDVINKILKIEETIFSIYQKLSEEEKKNNKNSPKYNELVNLLKLSIEVENKYFKQLDYETVIKSENEYNNNTFKSLIREKFSLNEADIEDNSFYCRIMNNLATLSYGKLIDLGSSNTPEDYEFIINKEMLVEKFSINIKLLDKYIEDDKYSEYIDELLSEKYYLLFENKDLDYYSLLEARTNRRNFLFNKDYNKALVNRMYDTEVNDDINYTIDYMLNNFTDDAIRNDKNFKDDIVIYGIRLQTDLELVDNIDIFKKIYYQVYKNILNNSTYTDKLIDASISIGFIKRVLNDEMVRYNIINKDNNEKVLVKE